MRYLRKRKVQRRRVYSKFWLMRNEIKSDMPGHLSGRDFFFQEDRGIGATYVSAAVLVELCRNQR